MKETFSLLKSNYLFKDLKNEQLLSILSFAEEKTVPKNEYVVREGEESQDFYLLVSGKLAVVKNLQQIAILKPGEVIGEMAFVDESPRSASVLALEKSKLLIFSFSKMVEAAKHKEILSHIIHNISKNLTNRLRKTDEVTVRAIESELKGSKIRIEMGRFLFNMLLILSVWIYCNAILARYSIKIQIPVLASSTVVLILFLVCIFHVKNSIYPLSYYGLTLNRWKRNLWEGILFTIPVLIVATIAKAFLMRFSPEFHDDKLIQFFLFDPALSTPYSIQILFPLLYLCLVPFQEFMARGTIQNTLKAYLNFSSHLTLWTIVLSNVLFAVFHAYISPAFGLFAFSGGCFWGWLYARQESLVGPIVSHAIVGIYCGNILGLTKLLAHF